MKKSSVCLLLALGGAVVGAAVAILVTPQSGKELRGKLRTAFNEAQGFHDNNYITFHRLKNFRALIKKEEEMKQ